MYPDIYLIHNHTTEAIFSAIETNLSMGYTSIYSRRKTINLVQYLTANT